MRCQQQHIRQYARLGPTPSVALDTASIQEILCVKWGEDCSLTMVDARVKDRVGMVDVNLVEELRVGLAKARSVLSPKLSAASSAGFFSSVLLAKVKWTCGKLDPKKVT